MFQDNERKAVENLVKDDSVAQEFFCTGEMLPMLLDIQPNYY